MVKTNERQSQNHHLGTRYYQISPSTFDKYSNFIMLTNVMIISRNLALGWPATGIGKIRELMKLIENEGIIHFYSTFSQCSKRNGNKKNGC